MIFPLAVGLGAQLLSAPLRRRVPTVTAVLLVALGLIAIFGRPASVTAAIQRHQHMEHEVPDPEKAGEACRESEQKNFGPRLESPFVDDPPGKLIGFHVAAFEGVDGVRGDPPFSDGRHIGRAGNQTTQLFKTSKVDERSTDVE